MRIGVFFRGPVRPSIEEFLICNKVLMSSLEGHEVETFVSDYNTSQINLNELRENVDNVVVFNEKIFADISNDFTGFKRTFNMFCVTRMVTQIMLEWHKKFDYIILSRADLLIHITNLDSFLNSEKYMIPCIDPDKSNRSPEEFDIYWDQFGIATPKIMFKHWDFKTSKELVEFSRNTKYPEGIVKNISKHNGVSIGWSGAFDAYMLHPNRSPGDPSKFRKENIDTYDNLLKKLGVR